MIAASMLGIATAPGSAWAASSGCNAVNSGYLNFTTDYVRSGPTTSVASTTAKSNTNATNTTQMVRSAGYSDALAPNFSPDNSTFVSFDAGDVLSYTATVQNLDPNNPGSSAIRVRARYGTGPSTFGNTTFRPFTSNGTISDSYTVQPGNTALGIFSSVTSDGVGGTIMVTATCTPAATAPTVASLSPSVGPTAGGTSVVLTGTGFTGATAVTFGGTAATGFTINSATQITATAPAGVGTVDVRVTSPSGTSATSAADQFTYVPAPMVTALSPTAGPAGGGTGVTITGTNLTGATSVVFGATPASSFTVNSATQITATAPTGSGTVDVRVTTVGGTSPTSAADQFTFVAAPTITAVAPAVGTTAGGTSVTLTGTNLAGATAVLFGGSAATSFVVNSATQITATTPAHAAGTVNVVATTAGGTSATGAANQFIYSTPPAAPTVLAPANGATVGTPTPTYQGTSDANVTITVVVDGTSIGTTTATGGGAWSMTQPTALASGSHTVRATATNSNGQVSPTSATNTFTVTPAPVANNYTLPVAITYNAGANTPTAFSIAGQASNSPTSYAVGSSTTANGGSVSINNSGVVTYTAATGFRGSDSFTYTASNAGGTSAPATVTVSVANPTLSASLSGSGTRGVALSGVQIVASGGSAPYSCGTTPASGTLPNGTQLNADCSITGTPTASGTFNFSASVTDSSTPAFTQSSSTLSLTIAAPTLTLSPAAGALPAATLGQSYSQSFVAGGGTAPYSFAITAGALPPGLTISTGGTLSGTPTSGGTFTFSVRANDSSTAGSGGPYSVTQSYSITASAPAITLSPATVPSGTVGLAYTTSITASGGTAPYSYAVTAGALPAGLTLATNGTMSGTPRASGTFNFSVTATDSSAGGTSFSATRTYALTIAAPTLAITPTTLPSGTPGATYSATLAASGGTAPYSFAVTAGALPPGLTLASDGTLAGTPTAGGTFNFTATATDSSGGTGAPFSTSQAFSLVIGASTVTVDTASLPHATVATAYSATIAASGGTGPYTFTVSSGALPTGLSLSTAGVLSGTATAGGSFTIGITATDSSTGTGPFSGVRSLTLVVDPPTIALAPATLPAATAGAAYSATLSASGGTGGYSFAVTGGALPSGLTLAANGVLSGTATAGGTFSFAVTATDSSGGSGPYSGTQAYTLSVTAAAVALAPATLPNASVAAPFSASLSASGGTAPYTFAVTGGALPSGVVLASNGTLSGTPIAGGSFGFTVTATDASTGAGAPYTASRAYTLAVAAPTLAITPATLPNGQVDSAYSATLGASGGIAPYSFVVTAGALPAGITLTPAGLLSGTPTAGGSFGFTVTATDSATGSGPYTASQAYTLVIAAPNVPIAGPVSASVPYGAGATRIAPALSGGAASSVAVASAPAHGTATATGTSLSYTPAAGYYGSDSFTYTATNTGGTSAPATVTISVATPPAPVAADRTGVAVGYNSSGTAIDLSASISGVADTVSITTAPAHGTATVSGTVVSYVPTNGYFGADSFAYAAGGPGGASTPATVSLDVATPPPPQAQPGSTSVAGSVTAGSSVAIDLSALVTGDYVRIEIRNAPAHGTVTLSGNPQTITTGIRQLAVPRVVATYRPAAGYSGTDAFTFAAVGPGGSSAPAAITITVTGTAPVAQSKTARAGDGEKVSVELTEGATGGPFTAATIVGVTPGDKAATAIVESGSATARGYRLDVTPAARFGGTIVVTYTLSNQFGVSQPATVTLSVEARPDPTADATVRAVSDAQAEAARRFARAQVANFMRRNEQLHHGGGAGTQNGLTLNAADGGGRRLSKLDDLAGIVPAPLGDEGAPARVGAATDPQRSSQTGATEEGDGSRRVGSLAVWTGGAIDIGTREANSRRDKIRATSSGLSAGIDLKLAEAATIGIGGGYGHDSSRIGDGAARIRSNSSVVALYGSASPSRASFVDGMIGVGDLGFRSRRASAGGTASGDRDGSFTIGALSFGMDHRSDRFAWSLYGRGEYMDARLDAYGEEGAGRFNLRFDRRDLTSVTGTLGAKLEWSRKASFGTWTPRLRAEWNHEFADADAQLLDYADIAGAALYRLGTDGWSREQLQLSLGSKFTLPNLWSLDLEGGLRASGGERAGTIRLEVSKAF